eukprot:SAG22_NODE_15803_length_340_cov_0.809129_1_plen_76_part_01
MAGCGGGVGWGVPSGALRALRALTLFVAGFHDECGHWHASGLKYNWFGLSVLNEDEHKLAPDQGQVRAPLVSAAAS